MTNPVSIKFDDKLLAAKTCAIIQQGNDLMLDQAVLAAESSACARIYSFSQNKTCNWRRLGRHYARERLQLARNLDGDASAAFGAAGINHAAATDRFHANPKSVCFLAACDGRLVSTFHGNSLLIDAGGKFRLCYPLHGLAGRTRHYRVF